eukprot:COSAG05_NODE_2113_length_3545_cov_82.901335_6_plen_155_part_00
MKFLPFNPPEPKVPPCQCLYQGRPAGVCPPEKRRERERERERERDKIKQIDISVSFVFRAQHIRLHHHTTSSPAHAMYYSCRTEHLVDRLIGRLVTATHLVAQRTPRGELLTRDLMGPTRGGSPRPCRSGAGSVPSRGPCLHSCPHSIFNLDAP